MAAYAAAKSGVARLVEALSAELKPRESGNHSGKSMKPPVRPLLTEMAEQRCEPVNVTMDGKAQLTPLAKALAMALLRDLLKAPLKEKLLALEKLEKWGVLSAREILNVDKGHEPPLFSENTRRLLDILREDVGNEDGSPTSPGW